MNLVKISFEQNTVFMTTFQWIANIANYLSWELVVVIEGETIS